MLCSNCGTENEAGLKFCGECGTRLAAPCPSCSTANPPGRRFCGECGTSLETTSSAHTDTDRSETDAGPAVAITLPQAESVAERKLVSVLFADLVGFTAASEARDPEEVRETLIRYFDLAREVIGRYGGSIEKFIGDAVMAVWGTPVAHEDDAERAVRAALWYAA